MTHKPAEWTWESFADHRIRVAVSEGQFDHLPGMGRPIPGIDDPYDERWWLRKKLAEEGIAIVPPTLAARRLIEQTRERLRQEADESAARQLLESLANVVREANRSPVPGPPCGVPLIDVDAELQVWRAQRSARGAPPAEIANNRQVVDSPSTMRGHAHGAQGSFFQRVRTVLSQWRINQSFTFDSRSPDDRIALTE